MVINETSALLLVPAILQIKEYFAEWIETIDLNGITSLSDFSKLINVDSDFFLTFNYTYTLENLYFVKNICHIHGEQGKELLFGHGENKNYFEDGTYGLQAGTEDSFQQIHDGLSKNTRGAINRNKSFFNSLNGNIDKICFFGFSFSKVDQIYLKEICENIDTSNVLCYFNEYDDVSQRQVYENIFKNCGFKCKFTTFQVSR